MIQKNDPNRKLRALILAGDGINCEHETYEAFRLAGFQAEIRHINDLISEGLDQDQLSSHYAALALPGGFSFGDDIASGRILALKIEFALRWNLETYANRGGLVIGICNGFQALIRLGIFSKMLSITHNESGRFINRWVELSPVESRCVWLQGVGKMSLPIRNGEGRILLDQSNKNESLEKLQRNRLICLRYEINPNGSAFSIAGLCNANGRIFGLMPHPEAFVRWTSHPSWTLKPNAAGATGDGLVIFENAFQAAKGAL